ncbi:T-cell immunoglobulin and mucin domain-containing protein 4 isoform X2 [Vicugna pacos]|uniref:T-cell immunoglobulin and mucin domain-containing protein 4 isoform X2 n=1 Tax=Vicugna pacos TaxID=30538 RepID=UPI003BB8A526
MQVCWEGTLRTDWTECCLFAPPRTTIKTMTTWPTTTTKRTWPTVTTKRTRPTITTKRTRPTVTTKRTRPTITTKRTWPTTTTKRTWPTVTTKRTRPTTTTKRTWPTVTTNRTRPTTTTKRSRPTVTTKRTRPTTTTKRTWPTVTTKRTRPTTTTKRTWPTVTTKRTRPTVTTKRTRPTITAHPKPGPTKKPQPGPPTRPPMTTTTWANTTARPKPRPTKKPQPDGNDTVTKSSGALQPNNQSPAVTVESPWRTNNKGIYIGLCIAAIVLLVTILTVLLVRKYLCLGGKVELLRVISFKDSHFGALKNAAVKHVRAEDNVYIIEDSHSSSIRDCRDSVFGSVSDFALHILLLVSSQQQHVLGQRPVPQIQMHRGVSLHRRVACALEEVSKICTSREYRERGHLLDHRQHQRRRQWCVLLPRRGAWLVQRCKEEHSAAAAESSPHHACNNHPPPNHHHHHSCDDNPSCASNNSHDYT